jgi:hypothetical protein
VSFLKRCKLFAEKTKKTVLRMTATNIPAWDWLQTSNSFPELFTRALEQLFGSGYLNQSVSIPWFPLPIFPQMIAKLDKLTLENKNNNYFFVKRIFWNFWRKKTLNWTHSLVTQN